MLEAIFGKWAFATGQSLVARRKFLSIYFTIRDLNETQYVNIFSTLHYIVDFVP